MDVMTDFAVVGVGCELPGARSADELWDNVLSVRRAFRRLPDARLNALDYYSDDAGDSDRTYLKRAALIEGYTFDRVKYRISKPTYEQTDLAHWLALDVTARALDDAGFAGGEGLPKERTGVVIGNSLAGEFSRANIMRLRWPYVRRVVDAVLKRRGDSLETREEVLAEMQDLYKAPFPAPDADMLAGGLANTIAGRIANYFDFGGGCYTVDGACSSSLLAIVEGCRALRDGMWDAAIVGGVDLSIDPFEVIGFTRNGALARSDMRCFDARSEGFWPGEGAGVAVLMRREDALTRGLPIYAVVRGWGLSSDGSGGITRPNPGKQALAMRRCYEAAGYPASDVAYFEAHGTGTRVGDEVELTAVTTILREGERPGDRVTPAIGSIKELIGHTKAAAGIAGFLKACYSVRRGIVPPGRTTDSPHPVLKENQDVLKRAQRPELWTAERPMRASVSGMGFGGINVHLTLEEAAPKASRRRELTSRERRLVQSQRDAEIIPFAAATLEQLLARLREVAPRLRELSLGELGDLSALLCRTASRGRLRLCFVCRDAEQLADQVDTVVRSLEAGEEPPSVPANGIFYRDNRSPAAVGFLFPGQGAPSRRHAGAAEFLAGDCSDLFDSVPWERDADGTHTSVAQPAIVAASLAGLRLLRRLNAHASAAVGHSLGEISALVWGESLSEAGAMRLATARGRIMADFGRGNGGMLALNCPAERARALLDGTACEIAAYNGPSAIVVAGDRGELETIQQRAEAAEVNAIPLRVSHAFHSAHMAPALSPFTESLETTLIAAPRRRVVSSTTGRLVTEDGSLRELLASQLVKPVLFAQAVEANPAIDLWIEVGPGENLSRTLRWSGKPVLPMDVGSSSLEPTLHALAAAYTHGALETLEVLSDERIARDLNLQQPARLFQNPCETVVESEARDVRSAKPAAHEASADSPASPEKAVEFTLAGLTETLRQLVSGVSEIPLEAVSAKDRVLSDLHLNSLVITEILAKMGRIFAPGDRQFAAASMKAFRDSSLADLAQHLFELVGERGSSPSQSRPSILNVDELPEWVNVLTNDTEDLRRARPVMSLGARDSWTAFGDSEAMARQLQRALAQDDLKVGRGVAVIAGRNSGARGVEAFLKAARDAREGDAEHFVLVQLGSAESIDSLAPAMRTFCLEQPRTRCTVVHLDEWQPAAARSIKTEASLCQRYHEVVVGRDGARKRPVLKPIFLETRRNTPRFGPADVFLVPGGGKGITFESARRIARYSGAALGLFGRSTPSNDAVLAKNLQRLAADGIRFHYVSADVTDEEMLRRAVTALETALGPVTAVLYGAGSNRPALLHDQTVGKWAETRSMKVVGLEQTLAALSHRPLRALVTYGSIIAESGLEGECDYALANEELARFTAAYAGAHPEALAVCLEWSVWSGVGMGETLGIIDRLKATGVSPIGLQQGLDVLERVLESAGPLPSRLTICSRYGALPTFALAKAPARDAFRFVEKPISQFPGIELVSEAVLSTASDPYLDDHVYYGQRVLPAVMAFEAMAQHAASLLPQAGRITIEHAVFQSPIIVPKDGSVRIRICASRIGERRFVSTIRSETSEFSVDCFRAELLIEPKADVAAAQPAAVNGHLVEMDIDRDFYDTVLFHTGQFRTVRQFFSIHHDESRAAIELAAPRAWFGGSLPQRLVLGHPGLNDAAAHCHQASVPQYSLLPASVDRVVFEAPSATGRFAIATRERSISQHHVTIDVEIVDAAGRLVQRWECLTFRRVDGSDFDGPWPLPLLNACIEHAVTNVFGQEGFRSSLEREGSTGGLRLSAPAQNVTGALLPLRNDAHDGPLQTADGLRRLLNRTRAALGGGALNGLDGVAALIDRADDAERDEDGWLAVSMSDERGSEKTAIARIFELSTGGRALGVFTTEQRGSA
jgi:enediyne polyketide synthase